MKIIIYTILIIFCSNVLAQIQDSTNWKKIRIGVIYTPKYSYRTLAYGTPNTWVEKLRNTEEIGSYGFTAGLALRKAITARIGIETGLYYTNLGVQTKQEPLIWTDTTHTDYPINSKTLFHYKYMEIPLKINYFLGAGKIKYFVSAGVSECVFMRKKSTVMLNYEDEHTEIQTSRHKLGYTKLNTTMILGAGINCPLNRRLILVVEPVYQLFLNSIVVDKMSKEYLWSVGLHTCIYL